MSTTRSSPTWVHASGPVVIPEQVEAEEIVAQLVPASGPVVVPHVEAVTEPQPEPEVDDTDTDTAASAETPDTAAATNGNGNGNGSGDPVSDFDDFEWSEEAQYAEPEVEVFVAPRPGGRRKKLAAPASAGRHPS